MSFRFSKIATVGLAATLLVATAADAFAIRNRYTNEQAEGFTGLFFEGFAPFYEEQPYYRPYRPARVYEPDYYAPPAPGYDRGPPPYAY